MGGGLGLNPSDCDIGNSPQMTKTSIMGKYGKVGKMSPLGGVGSRSFQMNSKGQ